MVARILVEGGYELLEADSAAEAIQLSDTFEKPIDLLIADHTLKTMTGKQVAEQICRSRPLMKVLQISGYSLEIITEEDGLAAGAEFLPKPFTYQELARRVRLLIGTPEITASSGFLPSSP